MINFDEIIRENTVMCNINYPCITNFVIQLSLFLGSGSEKSKWIRKVYFIEKSYLYVKSPYLWDSLRYLDIIDHRREGVCETYADSWNLFIEYSKDVNGVYENTEDLNPRKDQKILIVFDDMIAEKKQLLHEVTAYVRATKFEPTTT